jgi:hypothetical protein
VIIEELSERAVKLRNDVVWFFQRLVWWLPRMARWLFWSPRAFWLVVAGLVSVGSLWLPILCPEQQIRLTGLALELVGLTMAFIGLYGDHKQFGGKSIKQHFEYWLQKRPSFWPRVITAKMNEALDLASSASAHGLALSGPDVSLKDRVKILEQNYRDLSTYTYKQNMLFMQELKKLSQEINDEVARREVGDKLIGERLSEAVAGGFYLEAAGAIYFLLGLFLGTASPELAYYLRGSSGCPSHLSFALAAS